MKNLAASSLRAAALAVTLVIVPATFAQSASHAARQLATLGSVSINSVGPYVGVGTYLIQVSTKLGAPSAKISDDVWLYDGYTAGDGASGTLVVRFHDGRVTSLSLATPATIAALRATPMKLENKALAAAWNLR